MANMSKIVEYQFLVGCIKSDNCKMCSERVEVNNGSEF